MYLFLIVKFALKILSFRLKEVQSSIVSFLIRLLKESSLNHQNYFMIIFVSIKKS